MTNLQSKLESILFVASKPIGVKKIAKVLAVDIQEAQNALEELIVKYNQPNSGIVIMRNNSEVQMTSNPDNSASAENFLKNEISGELTRPQLETLTVISYCGPITKPELEQIRGVNCGLILRNLLLRGLVQENKENSFLPSYEVSMDYLRHLGIKSAQELPDYDKLRQHPYLEQL
ncbi:MAG: hypothetical protein COU31_00260 [Candidatus Magasanikbacteria bacterium CG10_big_fil_rev_8_21_14_0_10_40_10]|uniref:SMC-Scp complex subunit ScpB n=1 Tax=Candidatus Magasanikbacteria bacterium CG10_big_fil_rev_8_21_14_0_10_40_10 TaxID=1974648 RepID=A0A2M6W544_9BACT|nr:MAG: hypothetical protein COU31_00260 [Candidatus Magasanikbacteria bacterium CG10_big_fil_rev_8_21_14_0_10_40_10]